MPKKEKNNKKKKIILVVEIVVLLLLSLVLVVAIKGTQLLGLINYYETDDTKIQTASQVNEQYTTEESSGEDEEETEEVSTLSGYEVIALVGLDTRDSGSVDYSQNSDTMIICVVNHNDKSIRLCSIYRDTYLNTITDYYGNPNYYTKANSAYNWGGPEQFLSMINLNLDLNITKFVTVDFTALATCIDLLGGLDIDMTREEVVHVNNYNIEAAAEVGVVYEALEIPDNTQFDGAVTMTFHCNGSQAVSYARIRYTAGNDFRRASRQREVLSLIKEKASSADLSTLNSVLEAVLPSVTTNMDSASIISLALNILTYDMGDDNMDGFPFVHGEDSGGVLTGYDCVVPVTLEYNVTLLHNFLFPDEEYTPSYTVQEYSEYIASITGWDDSYIDYYASVEDYAELDGVDYDEYWSSEGTDS